MRTYFLFLIILVLGCSDEVPKKEGTKLAEVYMNGALIQSYEYTGDQLNRQSLWSSYGSLLFNHDYVYDSDTVLIYRYDNKNTLVYYHKFYSIDNTHSHRDMFDSDHNLMGYRIYIFDDAYCGFTGIHYYNAYGELGYNMTYQYTDSNCSLLEIGYNSDGSIDHTLNITRDDQNYYRYSTMIDLYQAPLFGNALSYEYKLSDDSIQPEKTFSSTFEYNSSGYPISEIREYADGDTTEFEYRYY